MEAADEWAPLVDEMGELEGELEWLLMEQLVSKAI